ncbi:MAG: electron transfer flavoprotein subunit beta/FixA family protein [Acidimicrobiia bacterium]|nr:electron transfer flavoprotein subunit beta/FixA family protein [Acidimicrobiia bacterium]
MNIAVLMRAVPDPVEELEISSDGTDLDRDFLGYVVNEFDEHALEEALLLKEETSGSVTVFGFGTADEMSQMLHTALAKGADAAVKLGDGLDPLDAHAQAELLSGVVKDGPFDLILSGVQASDELGGQVPMLLAAMLGWPHVSVVVGARPTESGLEVTKEYWAGITAAFSVTTPVVLGVQAARQPPRYVAVAKIREAQQSGTLRLQEVGPPLTSSAVRVTALRMPESGEGAEMITGDETTAAERIVELIGGLR